jgi:hypothetical protein
MPYKISVTAYFRLFFSSMRVFLSSCCTHLLI